MTSSSSSPKRLARWPSGQSVDPDSRLKEELPVAPIDASVRGNELADAPKASDLVTETDQAIEKMVYTQLKAKYVNYECVHSPLLPCALAGTLELTCTAKFKISRRRDV